MDAIKDIVKKIKDTILRHKMLDPGDKVIVAVSGGPDSICLLDVLNGLSEELKIGLVVAHYNHGLREAEDEAETRLVQDISMSMKLPFETERTNHLNHNDSSVEERARDARYAFLERVRETHNAGKIALGHNMNDQAETVLMRLIRGSGLPGLAGIPPMRDKRIIRPLIEVSREEIMDYLKARQLPYALDSSNIDTRFLRNRIRLELLPMMLDYQPQLIDQLGRLSNIIREEDVFMESLASDWIEQEAEKDAEGHISVFLSSFISLPEALRNRVARHILNKIGGNLRRIEYDHILSISDLAVNESPQAMIDLPNGLIVRKVYDRLEFISRPEEIFQEYSYTMDGPGTIYLEAIDRTVMIEEKGGEIKDINCASETKVYLDADKIQYPLIIRNFRPGDRFIPLGMKGHKKVKDFFIDLKIPSQMRALTPILTSQDNIVWICGYRIDDRFKVTPQTERIMEFTLY